MARKALSTVANIGKHEKIQVLRNSSFQGCGRQQAESKEQFTVS